MAKLFNVAVGFLFIAIGIYFLFPELRPFAWTLAGVAALFAGLAIMGGGADSGTSNDRSQYPAMIARQQEMIARQQEQYHAMSMQSLRTIEKISIEQMQAVRWAIQSGAELRQVAGKPVALLPDGSKEVLSSVEAEYWREVVN